MNPSEAELFLASCGAGNSLGVLMHSTEQGPPRTHVFDRPFFLVGRDRRSCLRLDDRDISRRHAYFQLIEGRLLCVDLASRTGVIWPGGKARASGWVAPSCRVSLGSFSLSPMIDPSAGEPPGGELPDWDPLQDSLTRPGWPQATIELSGGDQARTFRCRINRMVVLLGCAAGCRIRVQHPSVSRFHCSFVWTPLGVWLVDLLSREGTYLNGRPVSLARLADGDEIGVGAYRLRVHYHGENNSNGQKLPAVPVPERPVLAGQSTDVSPLELPGQRGTSPEAQLLLPVMQQFNQMQQQLCDQFQQTTLMMFRMFTSMHQEQASLIREELQQIQRVTAELQTLQRQTHGGSAPQRQGSSQPETLRPSPERAPEPLWGARPRNDRADVVAPPTAPPVAPAVEEAPAPAASPGDVDAWLSQRINELQAERQSRWQRVMSFLSGQ